MTILVTGSTGKVGSRLAMHLAKRGDQVRALIRNRTRATQIERYGIELAEGDLLNSDSLAAAVSGVETVIHCAAFFRGATPTQAHSVNGLGTERLAVAASEAGVKRFIFMSTGLVYGSTGARLASEGDACGPAAAYPKSKLAAEQFLLGLDNLDVRVLRLAFVYGDGDPHIEEVVPFMQGFSPALRLSIVHHADVAQAVTLLVDTPEPTHRIYNVVDDEAPPIAELFASVGAPPPNGSDIERGADFDTPLDGRRIRDDLNFKPVIPRLADAISLGVL